MIRDRAATRSLAALALAAMALAQTAAAQPPAAGPPTSRLPGYLTKDQAPDSIRLLGPPPSEQSGTKAGDVMTYQAARSLEGTARWALAARDQAIGPSQMMANFSCAVGVAMTPQAAPALLRLFSRLLPDAGLVITPAKDFYKRPRPFVEKGGKVCVTDQERDQLGKSWSYPSAHSTYGWLTGLAMAQAAPERATEILARARSYGESRALCGVHYESDVQAGRVAATGVFTALQGNDAFLSEVKDARAELARLRATQAALNTADCAIEAKASGEPVW